MSIKEKRGSEVLVGDIIVLSSFGMVIRVSDNYGGYIFGVAGGTPIKFSHDCLDLFPVLR